MGYGLVALLFFGAIALASVMGPDVKEEEEAKVD